MAKSPYQRLTPARSNKMFAIVSSSRSSLWLDADHLLVVKTHHYNETYKRFYFRDIQGFIVQKTREYEVLNLILAVIFAIAAVLGIFLSFIAWKIFFFSLAGIFALIALANLILGQTCCCFLQTAVQIEPLPSLNRLGRADKAFARIRPLIAAAQAGELSPQNISEQMKEPSQAAVAAMDEPVIPPGASS